MPMTLALHQNTSSGAGFQRSLEGWAKAGIRHVELTANLLDDFLKTNSLAAAKRVLTDNGLTPVSANAGAPGIFEPNPNRTAAVETLRHRCQVFAELGLPRIYQPAGAPATKFTLDDYNAVAANMREVGEIASQYKLLFMVEAPRNSTFIASLSSLLKTTRAANHPSLKPMFDFYHFWSGPSRMEDLDSVRPGEIGHVHFQERPSRSTGSKCSGHPEPLTWSNTCRRTGCLRSSKGLACGNRGRWRDCRTAAQPSYGGKQAYDRLANGRS